jgi:hypothetical protein
VRFFTTNDPVAHYRRLRAAGRELISKVNSATRHLDFDAVKAAKKMTLPVRERTLIFEGETEQSAFMDFYLHEFRAGGRCLLDACDAGAMGLSADERDLLDAHRASRTSLFEVIAIDARKAQIQLRDLLEPDRPAVLLADIALSQMGDLARGVQFFLRVVACRGIEMSSGSFFIFAAAHRQRLLESWASRMRTVAPPDLAGRRFIFFYQRNREFGEPGGFAEAR